jgi:hypothetical protein
MPKLWLPLLTVAFLVGCESAVPTPPAAQPSESLGVAGPATPGSPTGPSIAPSDPPKLTPAPEAAQCSRPTPSLVPPLVFQSGNLDLKAPYRLGFVQFFLVPCRAIDTIRQKYGLGPAALVITEPPNSNSDPDDIRSRYFKARVAIGEEAAVVTRLVAHPEDFQYVEFAFMTHACAVQGSSVCFTGSTLEPMEGPAGTSFKMRICCFPEGTAVTKTFMLPSGRTIVIRDTAGQDETVPAGWGGSAADALGTYSVTVTSEEIGSTVRFRIT